MKKSKKKKILIIVVCVLLLLIGGYWVLCVHIYNENFNVRFETDAVMKQYLEDFNGLQRTGYNFSSDKGQMLAGYMYSSGENQHGILIIAHGFGGGGHNSYMNVADYFAKNGYYVFAYDATGNDESEGEGVGGFPQGVIDLDHAISFVEENDDFPDLPIVLFGHSWGGYSVSCVLTWHPEVSAVIEISGCSSSSDAFEAGGREQAGDLILTMMPFIRIHERIKFGKYASNTALDGFANSSTAVMAVHSADDGVLPISYGYDKYYQVYREDPRFTFMRFEDRGHNYVFDDQAYIKEYNAAFDQWLETLDYDYQAEENKDRFIQDKIAYTRQHLDWSKMIDADLFEQFLEFYDQYTLR